MLYSEFRQSLFKPFTLEQIKLLNDFILQREQFGMPHRFRFLRNLAKTRKYTRTVYPPGWTQF